MFRTKLVFFFQDVLFALLKRPLDKARCHPHPAAWRTLWTQPEGESLLWLALGIQGCNSLRFIYTAWERPQHLCCESRGAGTFYFSSHFYSDFVQTFRCVFANLSLKLWAGKGFWSKNGDHRKWKLFTEISHFNEVNIMLYSDRSHEMECLPSTAWFGVLRCVAIFIL